MQRQTPLNARIVESRMGIPFAEYLQKCIKHLELKSSKSLLSGMGELMDEEMKAFVRTKLLAEVIGLLKFYKDFPITA